jgi:hypothetical protein
MYDYSDLNILSVAYTFAYNGKVFKSEQYGGHCGQPGFIGALLENIPICRDLSGRGVEDFQLPGFSRTRTTLLQSFR